MKTTINSTLEQVHTMRTHTTCKGMQTKYNNFVSLHVYFTMANIVFVYLWKFQKKLLLMSIPIKLKHKEVKYEDEIIHWHTGIVSVILSTKVPSVYNTKSSDSLQRKFKYQNSQLVCGTSA